MSLEELASVGTFVSGLGVVITLVFVTVQMRQTNKNQRALMQQGRSARVAETILKMAEPALFDRCHRAATGDKTISDVEFGTYRLVVLAQHFNWEDSFLQHRAGLLDAASWSTDRAAIQANLLAPGHRAAWRVAGRIFDRNYRTFIDRMLEEASGKADDAPAARWRAALTTGKERRSPGEFA